MELLGHGEDAEKLLVEVRERRKKHLGEDHYDTIVSIHDTGWLLRRRDGRIDEAEKCLKHALDRWTATLGDASPDSRDAASNLASLFSRTGRHDDAVECQQVLLDGTRKAIGDNHLACFGLMHNLALFEYNAGLSDKAHDHISRVVDGYRRFLPPNHRDMLTAIQDLGTICGSRKDFETAEELLLEALAGYEASPDSNPTDTMRTVNNIASLYDTMGRPEESRIYHLRNIEYVRRLKDAEPLELRQCAHGCLQLGEYALAEELLERVLDADFEVPGTSCHLARVLILSGRLDEARSYVDRASTNSSDGCPSYVVTRILFLQLLFAYMDGNEPTPYLRRLKDHLSDSRAYNSWDIHEVTSKTQELIGPAHFPLVAALANAICDKDQLEILESFPAWVQLVGKEDGD